MRGARQALDGLVVEPEIEDGLHHAGHGTGGAGANADEQRILGIAEFFLRETLELSEILSDLRAEFLWKFAAVLEVVVAGFRGDSETRWNREADARHLGEARALSAEEVFHVAGAV